MEIKRLSLVQGTFQAENSRRSEDYGKWLAEQRRLDHEAHVAHSKSHTTERTYEVARELFSNSFN